MGILPTVGHSRAVMQDSVKRNPATRAGFDRPNIRPRLVIAVVGVDNDRPTADHGRRISIVCRTDVVVIDYGIAIVLVPDLDAE
jgi:hypothetical protein